MKQYFVYILCNGRISVNYTGVTDDLVRRIYEHKNKLTDGFTKRYNVDRLIYFEAYDDVHAALNRKKEIKSWRKDKKMRLVRDSNPDFRDLYEDIT